MAHQFCIPGKVSLSATIHNPRTPLRKFGIVTNSTILNIIIAEGITREITTVDSSNYDIVIIGGGIIGLSVAHTIPSIYNRVAIVDPSPGKGTTWVAAGMLAAVTEAYYGEDMNLNLNMASAKLWKSFAGELSEKSGIDIGYRQVGTLVVAGDNDDRSYIKELYDYQRGLKLNVEWLSAAEARELVPQLAPSVRGAMLAVDDYQVDPRLVIKALMKLATDRNYSFLATRATSINAASKKSSGGNSENGFDVTLESGDELHAGRVIVCTGPWTSQLKGIPRSITSAVRPVKGEIVRVAAPDPSLLPAHTIRGITNGRSIYMVPRADGTLVIGATMEEKGFDTAVRSGAVFELLRDARALLPIVTELSFQETIAGLRPATPDNGPIIGSVGDDNGLIVAAGHYRNGILLTPITAMAVSALVQSDEGQLPKEVIPFSPMRLEKSA